MQKITMIEPRAPGYHVFSTATFQRLGLPLLGAMLCKLGYDVSIYVQDIQEIDFDDAFKSDLIMISSTTSTAPEAYRLADLIRYRDIPV